MSDKKGTEDKKDELPKVKVNPAHSDEEMEVTDEETPVAQEQKLKKTSVVSADSGAYSQDDKSVQQVVKKDSEDAGSSKTDAGGSHKLTPEPSPSKSKRSKSPIKTMKEAAQNIGKALKDTFHNLSPSKKSGLTDSIEVEHERRQPVSPGKEKTKKPKKVSHKMKLSEMYEKIDTSEESCDSLVTTSSNVPASDDTSVDEKSEILDDCEEKDDADDLAKDPKK